jgi:hypothetical protein
LGRAPHPSNDWCVLAFAARLLEDPAFDPVCSLVLGSAAGCVPEADTEPCEETHDRIEAIFAGGLGPEPVGTEFPLGPLD